MITISTGSRMKAVVCDRPGSPDVLKLEEIDRPVVPSDGVLIRVHTSSVNPVDQFPLTRMGHMQRSMKREVIGTDFAGTVEAVGNSVTQFRPGDEVFGGGRGAFAEYVCVSESSAVVRKHAGVPFERAAALPVAATTALQALRDHGRIQRGQKVLINGGSGGVGTFAVQIARSFGAQVTAVCSTRNVDIARSIGADTVIDYTKEDFTQSGSRYDLMLDIGGNRSWSECTRVLSPDGTYVGVGAAGVQHLKGGGWRALSHFLGVRLASVGGRRRVVALFIAKLNKGDLEALQGLVEAGAVTPVIDKRYALSEVPAALAYLNEGHAQGKIAIAI
jgi:NADPH:quinone reductase-like Zn-dependent oxidoreductase